MEVNLAGPMLRMALASGVTDDEDTAEMLRGLRGITVRVYSMSDALSGLSERLASYGQSLEAEGWSTLVRVRPDADDADDVWVYVRDDGQDAFAGMTVMALDHEDDEAAFVLIDGRIDPAQVGALGGSFGFSMGDETADPSDAFSDDDLDRIEADGARIGDPVERAENARDAAEQARKDARADLEEARREAAAARAEAQAAREEAARIRAGGRP